MDLEPDSLDIGRQADSATSLLCQRVRLLRQQRGWTLERLAEISGVSRSMLSQIERQQVNPAFHVAYRLAQSFGVSLGELVETSNDTTSIEVIRANTHPYAFDEGESSQVRTLHPVHLEKDVEFYDVALKSGAELESQAHIAGTREFVTVQSGRIRVVSGSDSVELDVGDSAHYRADVPHKIQNLAQGDAKALLVAVYQRRSSAVVRDLR